MQKIFLESHFKKNKMVEIIGNVSTNVTNLQQALDMMYDSQDYYDQDDYRLQCSCKGGNSTFVKKKESILLAPNYLIVNMDRASYISDKFNHIVQYPIDNLKLSIASKFIKYDLIAASMHSGYSSKQGHYNAYVRNLTMNNKQWFFCNDSFVQPCNPPLDTESSNAKFLIYQRKN